MTPAEPPRRYSAFVSYRHADNTQEGRRWAEWLHRGLERYVVPPDLIGTPNLRGEPIRDSLYPVFRDENELPASADLATGIRAALEMSDYLVVICSPRSAVSPWVRKEVKEFKELGRSDRILAIIIAGEPNADDPAKAREGILHVEECFCEELRFGAVRDDGTLDWTIRTEPLAADLRPVGTRSEGFVTAEAYREHLTLNSSLTLDKIPVLTEEYRRRLDRGFLMVAAGLLGVALGTLKDRDAEYRTALAEAEAAKQRAIAERERELAEEAHRAKLETEQTAHQLAIALSESNRQLERSHIEEGRSWLERGRVALSKGDNLSALMLAGRAVGYRRYSTDSGEPTCPTDTFAPLLGAPMKDTDAETVRVAEALHVSRFMDSVSPLVLPRWASSTLQGINCVAFRPDGIYVACGLSDGSIRLWDMATGKELSSLCHEGPEVTRVLREVKSISFSPDGSLLASGAYDGTICIWEPSSGEQLGQIDCPGLTSLAFNYNGTLLACGSSDKAIKVWDIAKGSEFCTFKGHVRSVLSVAFSPDGTLLASGSDDNTVKLWDASKKNKFAGIFRRLLRAMRYWDDYSGGEELVSMRGHSETVTCVTFSHDSVLLASGSEDKTVRIWDALTGKPLGAYKGHTDKVTSVALSPGGAYVVSGSEDGSIRMWDVCTGKLVAMIVGHSEPVTSVAFSHDGARLASGSGRSWGAGTIKLWDTTSHNELINLRNDPHSASEYLILGSPLQRGLKSFAFSPDGTMLASGSDDGTITFWDVSTGKELASRRGHSDTVLCVAFSSDGRRLASGSKDTLINHWNVATGTRISSLRGHKGYVTSVAFSPDGEFIASGSDNGWYRIGITFLPTFHKDQTMKFWGAFSGKELGSFHGHTEAITAVAFSPSGALIASKSENGLVILWDISTRAEHTSATHEERTAAEKWLEVAQQCPNSRGNRVAELKGGGICIFPNPPPTLDLTAPLRAGLLAFQGLELQFPEIKKTTPILHVRQDTLAQLADPKLSPEQYAELRMELCTKASQFRAATVLWQRLMQGEWPGFEGATVPKDQAPATVPADSPIRRLYLLALIDATKHPQIHGHPTICLTAAQIAPVLTKEMMAMPTISLAMMSLMQMLAKDESADMRGPREALLKRLDEVASKEWLEVMKDRKE